MNALSTPALVSDWSQQLIALLERQKAMIDRLASLAHTQAGLIAERHTDRLLELLAQRQGIIDEFTACQGEMSHLTQELDGRIADAAPPMRERIRGLLASISNALREVMNHDHEDQVRLRGGRDAVLHEMSSMDASRHARNAYASASNQTNRFADQHG
jgi:hypothetical protein